MNNNKYDICIIGAGPSGLAASIRCALFGKKVILLEKHSKTGGLNSYYKRGERLFDVGLHALTNFAKKNQDRKKPLNRIMQQLDLDYDSWELEEQSSSCIIYPENTLTFSNDLKTLQESIANEFPQYPHIDEFNKLCSYINEFPETNLSNPYQSAKAVIAQFISNKTLADMILCPLLIYGSASAMDMDFSQFCIMFKAIYLQGLSRPKKGVRAILESLHQKALGLGVEVQLRTGVEKLLIADSSVKEILLTNGQTISATQIYSSIGLVETYSLFDSSAINAINPGKVLGFCETIFFTTQSAQQYKFDKTLLFFNQRPLYHYDSPENNALYDSTSGVICCSENFHGKAFPNEEGILRVTFLANFDPWLALKTADLAAYKAKKVELADTAKLSLLKYIPQWNGSIAFSDTFTPTTIKRYTQHYNGSVYGIVEKSKTGQTPLDNVYICGTDQGFLGVAGALLSGITMANNHTLSR